MNTIDDDDDDNPYYVTILNDERIQILNSIGFLWGTKWEILWDTNFDALVKYKEEFGTYRILFSLHTIGDFLFVLFSYSCNYYKFHMDAVFVVLLISHQPEF